MYNELIKELRNALAQAMRVIEDNNLDEGLAGEYEIITDAKENADMHLLKNFLSEDN